MRGRSYGRILGASGPVVLNASRHWHRARLEGRAVEVLLNVCPGETLESLEAWLQVQARAHPRTKVATVLATRLPAAVADAWAQDEGLVDTTLAHLSRESRRRLIRALLASPLEVRDGRGYNSAEVTAGGIPLDEVDPARMESRRCAGLYLVGEMGGWMWTDAWAGSTFSGRGRRRGSPAAPSLVR